MTNFQITPSGYGKAVYYPNIEIKNPDWLKSALLYWDGVRRIVPISVTPLNSNDEVRSLVDEGLLENTPGKPYVEGAEKRFLDYLIPLLDKPEMNLLKLDKPQPTDEFERVYEVHVEKLSKKLRTELFDLGLARASNNDEWLRVSQQIGQMYMMCLATEMGEKIGSTVVTDDHRAAKYGEYLTFGQPRPVKPESPLNQDLLKLGLPFPTPESLSQVPMSKIIEFNRRHFSERLAFREAIEGIVKTANSIDDPNALEDYLQRERKRIESSLKDHRNALKELKAISVGSLLKISIPTVIASIASTITNPAIGGLLTGAGISLSAISWWAERRGKDRQTRQSNKWHYLLSVEKLHS